MPAVGGSIESVTFRGREFPIAADAEVVRVIGGFENEVMSNGDGTARVIKTRVPLSLKGITASIDDDRGDHEYLQELANLTDFFPILITYASGLSYQATAMIVGELAFNSNSATASIDLAGPGVVTKQ